ncbi:MAG: 5'/3'-nucleotidase SurE [Acidimicrobiia bacterium]|nr:5'/3'-nucleotidase SurE [Acidimicrobiia bacterium]
MSVTGTGLRVLVTNDDGIAAPGLAALAAAVAALGHHVVVAAPATDHSGASSAIGPMGGPDGVEVTAVELDGLGLSDVPAFAVDAPPALIVIIGRLGAFGDPPDVVVSGINPGPNTGRSTLHSGTVGAALTAANMGLSGLAVSIGAGPLIHYETAAAIAAGAVGWVAASPPKTVLNVNVPNVPLAEVRGVRPARLAPFGTVRTTLGETVDGRLQVELRETEEALDPDTDTALVVAGYVAVTPLLGIRAAVDVELEAAAAVEGALGLSRAAS